jgi:hypothetical protein
VTEIIVLHQLPFGYVVVVDSGRTRRTHVAETAHVVVVADSREVRALKRTARRESRPKDRIIVRLSL